MEYIIVFVISFGLGWVIRELHAKAQVAKVLTKVNTAITEEVKERLIRIVIEHQNNTYYVSIF